MLRNFLLSPFILAMLACSTHDQTRHTILITEEYAVDTTRFVQPRMVNDQGNSRCPWGYTPIEIPPKPIYQVSADFPEAAIAAKKYGTVWIEAFIDSTGQVTWAQVIKTDDVIFNRSALTAMMQWKFKPAMMTNNVPVGVCEWFPFMFHRQFD